MQLVSAERPQLVLEMHKEHIAIPVIMCVNALQVYLLVLAQKYAQVEVVCVSIIEE